MNDVGKVTYAHLLSAAARLDNLERGASLDPIHDYLSAHELFVEAMRQETGGGDREASA